MFNSYHAGNHSSTVSINAVTGSILRNHPKSWFVQFHLESPFAKSLFAEGGHKAKKTVTDREGAWAGITRTVDDPDKNIVILQMVICGDMQVIAECVYEKDYFAEPPKGE